MKYIVIKFDFLLLFGGKMIYFRGCVAREKLKRISRDTGEILKLAGIEYTILENEECCGSFLLRTGFREDAEKVMDKTLKDLEGEKILTSCAGCYKTFSKDYKEILEVELDVIHSSQLFKELIEKGHLEVESIDRKVTYHDPCHLGRHMEEYDTPREILDKITELVEMERNRENSRCCGAGAGVRSAFPEITSKIAEMRLKDADDAGVNTIITSCPFCILNLESACNDDYKILDLSEILFKRLKRT